MSHLPAPDRTAVPTTRLWAEAVGYCDIRTVNVSTSVSASFIQPAVGGTVTVAVATSTALVPGDTVAISGALATYRGGFYKVLSKPTTTSILAELVTPGIAPGGTVVSGADCRSVTPIMVTPSNRGAFVVTDLYADSLACPGFGDTGRCTISIGWNRGGTPFSEFYSAQQLNFVASLSSGTSAASLGAAFTQPAIGSSVSARLATPGVYSLGTWGFPLGTVLQVVRGGVYSVAGFTTTTTTANYTQPAVGGSVTINVASSTGFAIGDYLWVSTPTVAGAGVYIVSATTATSITCALNNVGSSFLPGVASASVIASGAIVTHGQTFSLTLLRDSRAAAGQSIATGNSVFSWREGKATTTATFVQPTIGTTVVVTVADNRDLVVGTTVWLNVGFGDSAGVYSVSSKTGLTQVTLSYTTTINYATGATVPVGATMHVRRPAGQVLPLRSFGTSRLAVDPGSPIAAYVSVAGDPTACALVAVTVRGYFVS